MKKKLVVLLSLSLVMLALAGCAQEAEPPVDEEPAAGVVKTGLAVISSIAKSTDAAEEDGLAQADSTIVAVTVDEEGKILNCVIDAAQTKINFSKEGKLVTPLDTVFVGKQELGAEYGMAKASGIGKEWNEQATALSDYVIGKTVEEVKGIAVTDEGVPAEEDLAASVTIHITDFIDAIEKAVSNAQELGASAEDKLGVGVVTTIDKSVDATEEDGIAQAYSNYAAVTFDTDGVITSCIIDASQTNVNFTAEGTITSNLEASQQTKNELGDAYGMKKVSNIGKEWYQQADAFSKYVIGKTVEEVKGIALTEEGVPADADLATSVTVHVGPFMNVIEKAYSAAK